MSFVPEKIGRYKILKVLGKGAMGVVYKALDPNIDRVVAIKAVRKEEFDDAPEGFELLQRFKREIQTAGLLTHSNIVTIFDGGIDDGIHWIAMEYVEGPGLNKKIQQGTQFSLNEIFSLMIKICKAMAFAHKHQIIHRDLKPANILLTPDGEPKIADFGIAKLESSTMTKTGVILGTPSYMSPEQVTGQTIDNRSDIFSLGIILYELVTGKRPFTGDNPTTIMYQIVHSEPVQPAKLNPSLPGSLSGVMLKALEKDPQERYQVADDLARDLARLTRSDDELDGPQLSSGIDTSRTDARDVISRFDEYKNVETPGGFGKSRSSWFKKFMVLVLILVLLGGAGWGIYWSIENGIWQQFFGNETAADESQVVTYTRQITFTADVPEADVFVDGERLGFAGSTPFEITRTEKTAVEVRIEKECYESMVDSFIMDSNEPLERHYEMIPVLRQVKISCVPANATLLVDGRAQEGSSMDLNLECGGSYAIEARASGYRSKSISLKWEEVDSEELKIELEKILYGSVSFAGEYGVTVRNSRGRVLGRNVRKLNLEPGNYNIQLTNRQYFLNINRTIAVKASERATVELPRLGKLFLTAEDPGNCKVTLSGFPLGVDEWPLIQKPIVQGAHTVKFEWGEHIKEETVVVTAGNLTSFKGERN